MLARVYNDHPQYGGKEYREKFRDEEIVIPAKGFVQMDYHDASMFMGQFVTIKRYDNGDPINPKALRMVVVHPCKECDGEFVNEEKLKDHLLSVHAKQLQRNVVHRCHLCREEFPSEESLLIHGIDKHKEVMIEDKKRKS